MLIPTPLLVAAQSIINRVLSLDPEGEQRLAQLEGKVVQIRVDNPNSDVFLMFLHSSVELTRFHDDEPDARISGSPIALMSLLRDSDSLFDGTVTVEGDLSVLTTMKKQMDELDVDWEEQLSGVIGDGAAHQVFRVANGLRQLFAEGSERLRQETGSFLRDRDRADAAVGKGEVTEYCAAVDTLRNDVDRLEAKISRLESAPGNKPDNP